VAVHVRRRREITVAEELRDVRQALTVASGVVAKAWAQRVEPNLGQSCCDQEAPMGALARSGRPW
jgi:hypothetical protein